MNCGRCGGRGSVCRGCAGLAHDHQELFGGCGVDVECPDCNGTGQVTLEYILSRPIWATRRFYHELLTNSHSPLGFSLTENQIDYLMEQDEEMPLRDAPNTDFPSDLDAYFRAKYEAYMKVSQ